MTSRFTKRWLFSRGEDGIVQKFTIARRRIRNGVGGGGWSVVFNAPFTFLGAKFGHRQFWFTGG